MAEIIINLFKRMKVGAKYKQMISQSYNESVRDQSNLVPGAKIIYNAQSTFHVVD